MDTHKIDRINAKLLKMMDKFDKEFANEVDAAKNDRSALLFLAGKMTQSVEVVKNEIENDEKVTHAKIVLENVLAPYKEHTAELKKRLKAVLLAVELLDEMDMK